MQYKTKLKIILTPSINWISKNCKSITKIFVLLVTPLLLAFWLFWYSVYIPIEYTKTSEETILLVPKDEKFLKPSLKNTIRKVFQIPFNLTYYELCVTNRNRYTTPDGTTKFLSATTTFKVKNEALEESIFGPNEQKCNEFNFSPMEIVSTTSKIPFGSLPIEVQIDTETRPDKARPLKNEQIVSSLLFIFSFWGICVLIQNIYASIFDAD